MSSTNGLYQCRLCLKRTSTKVNVLAGDFPKMLEILTSIKVKEGDGLPKYSCSKCAQDVKAALITKRRIIKAHKLLTESLRKKKAELVDLKIKEVLLGQQNTIKKVDSSRNIISKLGPSTTLIKKVSSPNASGLIFSNSRRPNMPQKPIEFVSVDTADNDLLIENSNRNSEITLTKVKPTLITKRSLSLQSIINRALSRPPRIFKCDTCNITFDDKQSFNTHSAKHKKTTCDICHITVRSDNFKKHLLLHTSGPTNCNICGATCKNIESLRGHIFYQHKSKANEYVCEECGKHFRIKYKFELHKKKEHTGVRNFKCETCGKAFFTNGNLMTHVNMTHKKLRPHICEFCGTGFSSSYALKTHKRQHTNEKPFQCDFCREGFRQKVSLRSHLKSKHNVEELKEHFCPTCGKGFATTYALSIHARLHMSQKCEVCSENFADKTYLVNHLKEAHNIVAEGEEKDEAEEEEMEVEVPNLKPEVVDIKAEH